MNYTAAFPDSNAYLFSPELDMHQLQAFINELYDQQKDNEFGSERYALLFKPGIYRLDIRVGYYTQLSGLGKTPDAVTIIGAVRTEDRGDTALCNFWRSVENITIVPENVNSVNVWAVSQAAPMRRVHIRGNLRLSDKGYSSGGFLANSLVEGVIDSGSQQQWLCRNTTFKSWTSGGWNMVFTGCECKTRPQRAENIHWYGHPDTIVETTPLIAEKPFLVIDDGEYFVCVPALKRTSSGFDWESEALMATYLPLKDFFVAKPEHSAEEINKGLTTCKHLLLLPGSYTLNAPLHLINENTVVLGLGLPTLRAGSGDTVIAAADVGGLRICGIMVDAGENKSATLVKIGNAKTKANHADNPAILYDLFVRTGGVSDALADCCLEINSNDVIGDNLWLWRADHAANEVTWEGNRCDNGITVNGNNVTIYGLAVEHFNKYQTIWNGDAGQVYFYQSEIPYDMPGQSAWQHSGVNGYASYKIADRVESHHAWGVGVYSYFRDATGACLDSAIEAPDKPGIELTHCFTYWLNGQPDSIIKHIINDEGEAAICSNKIASIECWPQDASRITKAVIM